MQQAHHLLVNLHTNPLGIDDPAIRLSWQLTAGNRGEYPRSAEVQISASRSSLVDGAADWWRSPALAGDVQQVDYSGPELASHARYWWRVVTTDQQGRTAASEPAFIDSGLRPADWQAVWIWRSAKTRVHDFAYFRKEIIIRKPVAFAKVFVSAHNTAQLYVDGQFIGGYGTPAPTNPDKYKYYAAYDVTEQLQQGFHCLAAIAHYLGADGQNYVNALPGFCLQLEVAYTDGTHKVFKSDTTWDVIRDTPHRVGTPAQQNRRMSAVEDVDARKLSPQWMQIGYSTADCSKAKKAHATVQGWSKKWQPIAEGRIEASIVPIERPLDQPAEEPGFGLVQVFDTGKIVTGWPQITLKGIAGATVRLRYSEELDADGRVRHNVCNETAHDYYDQYTMRGDELEIWQPNLSYKAFRYIEVSGYPQPITAGTNLQILSVHTDLAQQGYFHSSSELLNDLFAACIQTQKNNIVGQIVDCPHREQAQYLADSDLQAEALLYNFDARHMLEKVNSDFAASQLADGSFPFVYPANYEHPDFFLQIPEWDLHYTTILWKTYFHYGDERLLSRYYQPAKRMVDGYLALLDPQLGLAPIDKGWHISDWPYPLIDHSSDYLTVENIKLYQSIRNIADMAAIVGHADDQIAYSRIAAELKDHIVLHLYDADKRLFRDCLGSAETQQGVNGIALYYGLVPEADIQHVVDTIAEQPWTSRTVLSLPLLRVLFEHGKQEAAYRLINKEDYPGWGYMIKQGAATMWEGWDDHESHCHAWNGYPARLLQEYVVGIQALEAGCSFIRIKPYVPADLSFAEAKVMTSLGLIEARWDKLAGDGLLLVMAIPTGMTAEVQLEVDEHDRLATLYDGDVLIWTAEAGFVQNVSGVNACHRTNGLLTVDLQSGSYQFTLRRHPR